MLIAAVIVVVTHAGLVKLIAVLEQKDSAAKDLPAAPAGKAAPGDDEGPAR